MLPLLRSFTLGKAIKPAILSLMTGLTLFASTTFLATETFASAEPDSDDPYSNAIEGIYTALGSENKVAIGDFFPNFKDLGQNVDCQLQKQNSEGQFELATNFASRSYAAYCDFRLSKPAVLDDTGTYRIVGKTQDGQPVKSKDFTFVVEPAKFLDDTDTLEVAALSGSSPADIWETPTLRLNTNVKEQNWRQISGQTLRAPINGYISSGIPEGTYQFEVTASTTEATISRVVTVRAIKVTDPWILRVDGRRIEFDSVFPGRETIVDIDPRAGGSSWNLWGGPSDQPQALLGKNLRGPFTLPPADGKWKYRIDTLGPQGTVLKSFAHELTWLRAPLVNAIPSIVDELSEVSQNVKVSSSGDIKAFRVFLEASRDTSDDWFTVSELQFSNASWNTSISGINFNGTGLFKLRFKAIGGDDDTSVYSRIVHTTVHKGAKLTIPRLHFLAREGDDLTIKTSVENAQSVAWFKCENELYCGYSPTTLGTGSTFSFKNVSKSDRGYYRATAIGKGAGNEVSEEFSVYVYDKNFEFPKPEAETYHPSPDSTSLRLHTPRADLIYWSGISWEFKPDNSETWTRLPNIKTGSEGNFFLHSMTSANNGQYRYVLGENVYSTPVSVHFDPPKNNTGGSSEASDTSSSGTPSQNTDSPSSGGGAFFLLLIPLLLAAAIWFTPLRGMLGL